ncbi:MAG TPA: ribonuclease HIII [Kiritimatiellia bacterium]|nr:ribonuclease HIII [Kiritimatiellia bacterium]HSA18911.1 ribonuclease HIII [Kiritimatiellia bacterium]
MTDQHSFTIVLGPEQQQTLSGLLRTGNYRPLTIPHALVAAEGPDCRISLYKSGKCLVQGKGARDWVEFVLEPQVLGEARLGYEEVRQPEVFQPHIGVDESGKGDFFGPLVISAVYVDERLVRLFRDMNVRDSKTITSERKALDLDEAIRRAVGGRFALVAIGPRAYNRLYASMGNVNRILAWGHARAIENVLERVPDCPRAVADQFGPKRQIEQALMKKGRKIKLEQRPRAESDPAVAAASIVARAGFVRALQQLGQQLNVTIPKGASDAVRAVAVQLVKSKGAPLLLDIAKCHFRTADQVLAEAGSSRAALGPDGQAVSKPRREEPS